MANCVILQNFCKHYNFRLGVYTFSFFFNLNYIMSGNTLLQL